MLIIKNWIVETEKNLMMYLLIVFLNIRIKDTLSCYCTVQKQTAQCSLVDKLCNCGSF